MDAILENSYSNTWRFSKPASTGQVGHRGVSIAYPIRCAGSLFRRMDVTAPSTLASITSAAASIGFNQSCDARVGCLLRTLAASKPGGRILELGTGAGCGTAWLLDGMHRDSQLVSVENDGALHAIAYNHLQPDARLSLRLCCAEQFLDQITNGTFDMIFADTWSGKYNRLDKALAKLNKGGYYVIDDMLPQSNWPDGHEQKVADLFAELQRRTDLTMTWMDWATGVVVATKL